MDLLNGMLQKDQDEFRRICNKLINVCFICRQNQATRSDFYFIQKYKEKFEELLGVLGYRLEMNDEYGVVQLTNALNIAQIHNDFITHRQFSFFLIKQNAQYQQNNGLI